MIAGRAFSKNFGSDFKESMVINEAAVKQLGFANAEEAIGKHFWQRGGTGLIIGVVKDFHFHSLHEEIQPLTMQVTPGFFTFLTLSVSSDNLHQTINRLEKKWAALVPGLPMIYSLPMKLLTRNIFRRIVLENCLFVSHHLAILISCFGFIRFILFQYHLAHKRNWHQKSTWRITRRNFAIAYQRISHFSNNSFSNRFTNRVDFNETLVK